MQMWEYEGVLVGGCVASAEGPFGQRADEVRAGAEESKFFDLAAMERKASGATASASGSDREDTVAAYLRARSAELQDTATTPPRRRRKATIPSPKEKPSIHIEQRAPSAVVNQETVATGQAAKVLTGVGGMSSASCVDRFPTPPRVARFAGRKKSGEKARTQLGGAGGGAGEEGGREA